MEEIETQAKRPRGRPRKNPVEPDKPKRPRGRPRKHPVVEPDAPKRPRGRPRKNPDAPKESAHAVDIAALNKTYKNPIDFLRAVMNYEPLEVNLRISAAKALMPYLNKRETKLKYESARQKEIEETRLNHEEFIKQLTGGGNG